MTQPLLTQLHSAPLGVSSAYMWSPKPTIQATCTPIHNKLYTATPSDKTCTLEEWPTYGMKDTECFAQRMSRFCITHPGTGRGRGSKQLQPLGNQTPCIFCLSGLPYALLLLCPCNNTKVSQSLWFYKSWSY